MMKPKCANRTVFALGIAVAFVAGCDSSKTPAADKPAADRHDDHAHNKPAPHGGHLVELGREHKYHAEIVEDIASERVTVYILNGDLQPTPADEDEISLVLSIDGQAKRHTLISPAAGELGHGTQFAAQGSELFQALHDAGDATGKLMVTIADVPYIGRIQHDHDHAESERHAHEDAH